MALKMYLDSLDGLSDEVKSFYTEEDGKFALSLEDGSVKSAIAAERDARQRAEKKARDEAKRASDLAKSALSEDELKEFEELRAQAEKTAGADKLIAQIKARHEQELETKKFEAQALRQTLEQTIIKAAATQALAGSGADVKLLMPHILGQLKVEEIDGKMEVVPTDAIDIPDIIKGLRDAYPAAFADMRGSGGGGKNSGGGGNQKIVTKEDFNSMRPKERAKFISSGGRIENK